MTSHPFKNATSRKRVASTLSASDEQKVVTNGQLGSYMLRNHGRFYESWLTHAFAYIIMKEYYDAEEGCAYPSVKRLASELNINARTVSRLVKQMKSAKDENGNPLWRIETGRNFLNIVITNRYYPLFTKAVLADPKRNDAKLERENTDVLVWDGMNPKEALVASALLHMESTVEVHQEEVMPELPESDNDTQETAEVAADPEPEVSTEPVVNEHAVGSTPNRDQEILALYKEAQELRETTGFRWAVPMPVEGTVVDVLLPSEVVRFRDHGNPDKIYVAGTEDVFLEEMPGKWIAKFGSKFGKTITATYIQGVYDVLLENVDTEQAMKRDAVMYVLGSRGIKPTAPFVKFLLSSNENVTPEQKELRDVIQATVIGRKHTQGYVEKNLYGNYTLKDAQAIAEAEARMAPKVYSDQF